MYYIRAGKNFNNYTPQLFQNMIDRSYMPTHLIQIKKKLLDNGKKQRKKN